MDIAQTAPETLVLAEDEASLYLQATTTSVWAPCGHTPVVRVHPNRDKVSFYATLNLHTGQAVATREEMMNGEATARHLEKVLSTYPDVPILLLWDRAKWHGGPAVRVLLQAHPRLEVMRFPTAAPDLNPQEMVWKATRAVISHNHDERQLVSLADRFEQHLASPMFCYSMLEKYDHGRICAMFNFSIRKLTKPSDVAIFVFYRCDQHTATYISNFLLYLRTSVY